MIANARTALRMPAAFSAVLALVLAALSGCTTTVQGTGVSVLTTVGPDQLCPGSGTGRAAAAELVRCLSLDVSQYWTIAVGTPVYEDIVVAPEPESLPEDCREGLALGTAFYCDSDARVYITRDYLDRLAVEFGDLLPYALAETVAHEYGHVMQSVADQPGLDRYGLTDADTRIFEQQADCLAGVWAHDAARAGQLNPTAFRAVFEKDLKLINALLPAGVDGGYDEVATHGTLEERMAAYDRGVAGRSGTACDLVGLGGP